MCYTEEKRKAGCPVEEIQSRQLVSQTRRKRRKHRRRGGNLFLLVLALCVTGGLAYRYFGPVAPVMLEVNCVYQQPELPNGCEAASLAAVLNYLSYPASKTELAEDYIPRGETYYENGVAYSPDPRRTYVGDPWDSSGFYILAPGLAAGANAYLAAWGGSYTARDISGAGERELIAQLQAGRPVIVWTIMYYTDAQYADLTWVIAGTSERYIPYANLHCRVLFGVEGENFYLADPIFGVQAVNRETVMDSYQALGSQAVVIVAE